MENNIVVYVSAFAINLLGIFSFFISSKMAEKYWTREYLPARKISDLKKYVIKNENGTKFFFLFWGLMCVRIKCLKLVFFLACSLSLMLSFIFSIKDNVIYLPLVLLFLLFFNVLFFWAARHDLKKFTWD